MTYIAKAEVANIDTTISGIVVFFTKEDEKYLDINNNDTMSFLTHLADFWIQSENYLNDKTMMYMSVLDKFPYVSWKSLTKLILERVFKINANILNDIYKA